MAILAYVGIPGSGKSYEVVSSVILEHFKKGRRIVSNIEGVTHQKLVDYCLSKGAKLEELGEFISVDDETCQRDDFFPYKGATDSICRAGDLICIDEVWRIFPSDKLHENHRSFLAEHRHFTNEMTYQMSKLTALGMRNRYRVDVFTGAKTTKTNKTLQLQRKYDKSIFPLYKSYDGSNGKENVVDDGKNSVLVEDEKTKETSEKEQGQSSNLNNINISRYVHPKLSEKWRITGELKKDGKEFVILSDMQGRLRFEPRSAFSFGGRMLEGKIDGELVNYYSGEAK